MVHPTPNRLVRHRHSAFRQQIFDVAQAEGEPEVKPYRLLNDLGRETNTRCSCPCSFAWGYPATENPASPDRRDNAGRAGVDRHFAGMLPLVDSALDARRSIKDKR